VNFVRVVRYSGGRPVRGYGSWPKHERWQADFVALRACERYFGTKDIVCVEPCEKEEKPWTLKKH
jgi:hypothetical protein